MALALIIALVILLYARTLNYNYVIDDNVKRNGYMYEVPLGGPQPGFFETRPPKLYRVFMIGMHCVNVSVIYLLWGWAPALLFAVHPLGVWGTAWVTGNYYATTAYFCLIAYYILSVFPNIYGALAAMAIFTAALNSTVCCITFPFLFLFIGTPWGLTLFLPLAMYLKGNRFTTGIKIRLDFNKDKPVDSKFTWRRLIVMTKVVARYIHCVLFPEKQGFFRGFGTDLHGFQENYDRIHSANEEFWESLAVCLAVFLGGLFISPVGTMWFFGIIMLHSQWNLTGQFFADRYAYLPLVGLCLVAGTVLQHYPLAMTAIVTYLVYKTNKFIPVWKTMNDVYRHDVEVFPENAQVYSNLAQSYMINTKLEKYRVNEIASLLQKSLYLNSSWEAQMNMACFCVMINNVPECIKWTKRAIATLEPFAAESGQHALNKLKEQLKTLETETGRIGGAKVPPLTRPNQRRKEHDKSKSESETSNTQRVPQPA